MKTLDDKDEFETPMAAWERALRERDEKEALGERRFKRFCLTMTIFSVCQLVFIIGKALVEVFK